MSPRPRLSIVYVALSTLLALLALAPTTSALGIVNGYCNGGWNSSNLACSLKNLQSNSAIINSLSITTYHLDADGAIATCSPHADTCPFPGDVEQYSAEVLRSAGLAEVVPLVFDNDGNTIASIRAMYDNGHAAANLAALVNATLRVNYTGLSIDWEPSCWLQRPSQCTWPSVAEAQRYTAFVTQLSAAFRKVGKQLTVCADHEVCEHDCRGDYYLKQCAADAWSMAQCNCCAFQTWFNASALCAIPSAPRIAVMDSYDDHHPFNASVLDAATQPWYDAGCTADRMSFGLLTDQALTEAEAAAMLDAVRARGVTRVDLWSEPWTHANLTTVWKQSLLDFIADGGRQQGATAGGVGEGGVSGGGLQRRHAMKRLRRAGLAL